MKGHRFGTDAAGWCLNCRAITRAEFWHDRDMLGVVRRCLGW